MHNMGQQQGGRAYLDSNDELMEIPAPNIFSMQTQEMQWDDFEPEEGQRRPNRFNMEIRKDEKDREEKEKDKSRKALL